jgi:hypothetical protein
MVVIARWITLRGRLGARKGRVGGRKAREEGKDSSFSEEKEAKRLL